MAQSYPPNLQKTHIDWLTTITAIPTAAGREHRVIDHITRWAAQRPDLALATDDAGNLTIQRKHAPSSEHRPLYITAHLDHPAFVVEAVNEDRSLSLTFRGGVRDAYFNEAPILVITQDDQLHRATITALGDPSPVRSATATLKDPAAASSIAPGDIARWDLPDPQIIDAIIHTHACDDLSGVAAALAALDRLREEPAAAHVRLFFSRAEEIGCIGTVAAMKSGTLPRNARLVLLENSRSFPDSPIGAGPIVRVGDRLSTFDPRLTAGLARVAKDLEDQRKDSDNPFRWQRKLMPGGACEATVFQAHGYEAACLCLPLGAYHNMANIDAVLEGDEDAIASARAGREHVAISDYLGLIDLLVAAGTNLENIPSVADYFDKAYNDFAHVLD